MKIELVSSGIRELLRSDEFLDVCAQKAEDMAAKAGAGFEVSKYTGSSRVNASVYAATKEALRKVYSDNTLLKSMGISDAPRQGKKVQGYYRRMRDGRLIWVNPYQRKS